MMVNFLMLPCEIAVKSLIPAIKAHIAKELMETQGLKQEQVAEILGVSQSAVSKYTRKIRGCVIRVDDIEEIQTTIDKIVSLLMSRNYQRRELLAFFCQTCETIRKTSRMCHLCHKAEPTTKTEQCMFCVAPTTIEK